MKKLLVGFATVLIMFSLTGISSATTINFDDIVAPNLFVNQTPLAEEYSHLGVHFVGSGEVMNYSGGFGVGIGEPFTSPNFLAFNSRVFAFPPETINFDININYFSLDFAGSRGTISLTGFNQGNYVGAEFLLSTTSHLWSTITLSLTAGFDSVVFNVDTTDYAFVVDNLKFNESVPVPEPSTMFLLGLGLAVFFVCRKTFQT